MSFDYAYEKFFLAIMGMAQSKKKLRERIEDAYVYHPIHVRNEDIPDNYRSDFRSLKELMTSRPARFPYEGRVRATTQQMSPRQLEDAARLIVGLFDAVTVAYHERQDKLGFPRG